jgi:hypothetical protein
MTDEQRLQMITDQLILVRDNLFRGMSKSIQKLQARSINEVLKLENYTQSAQRTWAGSGDLEDSNAYQTLPAAQPAPVPMAHIVGEIDHTGKVWAPAQPAVPDAFGTREGEHPQYVQGWNDCRAEMLKGMK